MPPVHRRSWFRLTPSLCCRTCSTVPSLKVLRTHHVLSPQQHTRNHSTEVRIGRFFFLRRGGYSSFIFVILDAEMRYVFFGGYICMFFSVDMYGRAVPLKLSAFETLSSPARLLWSVVCCCLPWPVIFPTLLLPPRQQRSRKNEISRKKGERRESSALRTTVHKLRCAPAPFPCTCRPRLTAIADYFLLL